ncbi:hypothetical protein PPL_07991 [Heterostelium album PN500]|uniref:DNA2/NAM7 helicase-like C-terminal domain-containing protein n=1 Tax=Heterostelium pallidum (strain ATCC 26659 / Pp 5 / PN500) TaxID=670386 RepID=D3BHI9_HETP5|nr:hypothetical protein PPL_07991 [Heterostelium album PN500]EFA79166.1 hypothetical protein PPL_07991 [Heterostelium album PN500]|eukprot:XP_020431287.1 hypothetical protein PPL_07991 [Heterostelium album PN500]
MNSNNNSPQSVNSSNKRIKTLKSLLEDGLITVDDQCYFVYNKQNYQCKIVLRNGKACFFATVEGNDIVEDRSTTFIKKYIAFIQPTTTTTTETTTPTSPSASASTIEGNNIMYINNKRISDYVLLDTASGATSNLTNQFANMNMNTPPQSSKSNNNNKNTPPSSSSFSPFKQNVDSNGYSDSSFVPSSVLPPQRSLSSFAIMSSTNQHQQHQQQNTSNNLKYSFRKMDVGDEKQSGSIEIEYQDMEPARIKPSGVGRYFHFNCDRYLAFSTREKSSSNTSSTVSSSSHKNTMIDGGFAWEEKVAATLKGTVHIPAENASAIPYSKTMELLKTASDCVIFQSTLEPPASIRRALLPSSVSFSISIPDFLQITTIKNSEGQPIHRSLKILDAKSTGSVVFSQKIQLAFYYLLLGELIQLEKIDDLKLDDVAAIYLKGIYEPVDFQLLPTVKILETFLYGDKQRQSQLLAILSTPKYDADWRLTERCDGCEYLDHCKSQAIKEKSQNLLPKPLSPKVQLLMENERRQQQDGQSAVTDLDLLYSIALNSDRIDDNQTRIELVSLLPYIRSIIKSNSNDNSLILTSYKDLSLNSKQDHEVYLCLQQNPITQELFGYSVLHINNTLEENNDSGATKETVYSGFDSSSFVKDLASLFNKYNKSKESLQCFIYDYYERSYLFGLLAGQLKSDPTNKDTLTILLTLLHSSEWINFNLGGVFPVEIPGNLLPSVNPLIIIQEQVSKSIATGIFPILSLGAVAKRLLLLPSIPTCLDNDHIYVTIIAPNHKDKIAEELKNRLLYTKTIKDTLLSHIFKTPKVSFNFKIRDIYEYKNPLLNKLKYCHHHDLLAGCKEIQSSRSRSVLTNVLDGKYLIVKYIGSGDLHVFESVIYLSHFSGFMRLFCDKFTKMMLVENSDDGLQKLESFNDMFYSTKKLPDGTFTADNITMNFKSNVESDYQCLVSIVLESKDSTFQPGKEYILSQRFDINFFAQFHPMNKGFEAAEQQGEKSPMLNLFKNPLQWTNNLVESQDPDITKFIEGIERTTQSFQSIRDQNVDLRLSLTDSQLGIVKSIVQRRLQLVVGPPGTGKTHFLALMVLIIMETLIRAEKKSYIIAITAHTHTAIDNLLVRIAELKKEYESFAGNALNFQIVKKESSKLSESLTSHNIVKYDKKHKFNLMCIGSTCWGLNTLGLDLDMLIIDEASQLPSPLAALGLNAVNLEKSRVVVVGDPKQLGPVLKASFIVRKDLSVSDKLEHQEPKFHKSIFSCLKGQLEDRGISKPFISLCENFRMTDNLCRFFSINLYGPSYQSFLPRKEEPVNKLLVSPQYVNNDLIQTIFKNNDIGCHTILLNHQQFGNRSVEAEIVRQIYKFTRDSLQLENKTSDEIEEQLWSSKTLGVVTPMNIQRVEIQQMLVTEQQKYGCREQHMPHVTTAEKMQGQEFDTIVICYNGWSANIKDSDFIFNRNRLNVSFSRAKKRIVLIISSSLLKPDEKIFNNRKTDNAYRFLNEFIKYSSIHRFQVEQVPATPLQNYKSQSTPQTPQSPTNNNNNNKDDTPTTPITSIITTTIQTNPLSPQDERTLQSEFMRKLNMSNNNDKE